MSLIDHWKTRREHLGVKTRGRPVWIYIALLALVIFLLMNMEKMVQYFFNLG